MSFVLATNAVDYSILFFFFFTTIQIKTPYQGQIDSLCLDKLISQKIQLNLPVQGLFWEIYKSKVMLMQTLNCSQFQFSIYAKFNKVQ